MSERKSANNFYFSGLSNNGILNKDDNDSLKFIILQNDTFHGKVQQMTNEIQTLKTRATELEEDNEKLETSKLNLRSYLRNEIILKKLYKELNNIYLEKINYLDKNNIIKKYLLFMTFFFLLLNLMYPYVKYYTITISIIILISKYTFNINKINKTSITINY